MNPTIQDTLLQLFEHVRLEPDSLPGVQIDEWQVGSTEWRLLESFRGMAEQVQQRILQLRQAEEQLREREEQYRAIFEATIDGLSINDLEDGRVIEANPALCNMFGYTYEEFINLLPTATIHPDTYHVVDEVLQKVQTGNQFQTHFVALRKDGTVFNAEGQGTPFIYKGKPHLLGSIRDITEQVQAIEQLREKEEQYRAIFEATSDALLIGDLEDGHVVEVNPAACQMYGYSYEEFLGLAADAITHPDSLILLPEALQTIQEGHQLDIQGLGLHKDGTPFHVEARGTPFTFKGTPHLLTVAHDITDRMEAEQKLREREEQYRSIFEAASDGLIIVDLNGFVVQANPAACQMYGYTHEEFLGLQGTAITSPDSLHLLTEALQTIKLGEQLQAPIRSNGLRKDGTTFLSEGYGTPFIYNGKSQILAIVRDITERVKTEQELREREEQYRGVFESTYDGISIIDLGGFFVEVNPAFCNMFGYTREELIGVHASILAAPDFLPVVDESLELLRAGRDFQTVGQGLRKDGTMFYLESHSTTFTYRGKQHSLGVSRDISEQVQAQQILEQRVEERTRELSTLLEVSHNVASTLELKPLLNLILNQIKGVVEYTAATILILDGDELVIVEYLGPAPRDVTLQVHYPVRSTGVDDIVLRRGEPVIIDDVRASTPLAQDYREAVGDMLKVFYSYLRALMVIPLKLKDRVIGMLSLSSNDVGYYTPHHTTLALAIANQAAIAIENARLYEQAQTLAAVEERQRLARELHDSVSQALYGISLGVHTARLQLDRDPKELAESLDYVLELAEAALIEMRALIFELRPESLETEGLVTALTKQAAALHARQNITVNTDLCTEPDLPLKVKQDLYRVAQEALHNTIKHAYASKIELRLHQTREAVTLEVCDNGRGFDATASFPGHLGLHSMQERVTGLGGELQIESVPGQGTCIRAQIPAHIGM